MDPIMFLAAHTPKQDRPDARKVEAFYQDHGTVPLWTRARIGLAKLWTALTPKSRKRGSFALDGLRMVD